MTQQQYIETIYAFCGTDEVEESIITTPINGRYHALVSSDQDELPVLEDYAKNVGKKFGIKVCLKTFHCISSREI